MADKQINLTDFLRELKEKQKNIANQDTVYIDRDSIPFTTIEVTGQCGNTTVTDYEEVAYKRDILALPTADVVACDCYDKILWENDIMRQQLADIGKKFGEKMDDVRPVVRAEFVRCGDGKGVPYMCSHCGRITPANMVEIWGVNFCPNCGADMREES